MADYMSVEHKQKTERYILLIQNHYLRHFQCRWRQIRKWHLLKKRQKIGYCSLHSLDSDKNQPNNISTWLASRVWGVLNRMDLSGILVRSSVIKTTFEGKDIWLLICPLWHVDLGPYDFALCSYCQPHALNQVRLISLLLICTKGLRNVDEL